MFHKNKNWVHVPFLPCSLLKSYRIGSIAHFDSFRMQNFSVFLKILEKLITMLIAGKIAKKIAFSRSRLLNFAIAIVLRSFKQMAISIAEKRSRSTIKKIADHSYLGCSRKIDAVYCHCTFCIFGFVQKISKVEFHKGRYSCLYANN